MKTNIRDLPDEKLIELCAEAQGWELVLCDQLPYWYDPETNVYKYDADEYNPLANTQAGKAQAMELLDKMRHVDFYPGRISYYPKDESMFSITVHAECKQRQIVIAYIISKYGDNIEYDGGVV